MIDANGSRYHLLSGRADFGRCTVGGAELSRLWAGGAAGAGFSFSDAGDLTLEKKLFHPLAGAGARELSPEDRRGAAADRFGNLYFVAGSGTELRVRSSGSGEVAPFWPLPPRAAPQEPGGFAPAAPEPAAAPRPLGGLAVTSQHYLLAGVSGGLLVFDLVSGGPPRELRWPQAVPFAPFDLAPTTGGGALVLDRQNRRFWRLDAALRVLADGGPLSLAASRPDDFQPREGPLRSRPAELFPAGVTLAASSAVQAIDPIAIDALDDGRIAILDRGLAGSTLLVYDGGDQLFAAPLRVEGVLEQGEPFSFPLLGQDLAAHDGLLFVAAAEANQTFAFTVEARGLALATAYFPMRLFSGGGLFAGPDGLLYDYPSGFLPLVEQRRPRYASSATLRTPVLDGGVPGCVWHRLLVDGCIPPGSSISIASRAADEATALETTAFSPEPEPYLRRGGSELPFVAVDEGGDRGTFELLFQRAQGRYAQLEITLQGRSGSSPRIRAVRAWYPRFSYNERYLPGAYRRDPDSASFLERFLANVEGTFTGIEDFIAAAQVLFDPRTAPPEALDWLAEWFAVSLDPSWDQPRRRLFLRHATRLFQWRGTPRGLRMALRLALDESPTAAIFEEDDELRAPVRIVERFRAARRNATLAAPSIAGIRPSQDAGRWDPSQPGAVLARGYFSALAAAGLAAPPRFPVRVPSGAAAAVWTAYVTAALGFVPAATDADASAWQDFLARRYRRASALAAVYREDASLPIDLPGDGAPLTDWHQFEALVLPMRAAAHRFTVSLPLPAGTAAEDAEDRRALALRVLAAEKPAHTVCDVDFYWAMFRVGSVRLGADTLLDLGGRTPALLTPMLLGRGHLAESVLAPSPLDAVGRPTLGSGPLQKTERPS